MSKLISMDKRYKTRDGRDVRVLCTDVKNNHSVAALIGDIELVSYTKYGEKYSRYSSCNYDLIEQPETISVWVEVFKSFDEILSCSYESENAMRNSINDSFESNNKEGYQLLATKKIVVTEGEFCS